MTWLESGSEKFLFRVENRKHVLTVAWNFFKYINDVRYCIVCVCVCDVEWFIL